MSVGPEGVTWCPHCRGWARTLGAWVVPHLRPGRRGKVCVGSSEPAQGEVIPMAEWVEDQKREHRGGGRR